MLNYSLVQADEKGISKDVALRYLPEISELDDHDYHYLQRNLAVVLANFSPDDLLDLSAELLLSSRFLMTHKDFLGEAGAKRIKRVLGLIDVDGNANILRANKREKVTIGIDILLALLTSVVGLIASLQGYFADEKNKASVFTAIGFLSFSLFLVFYAIKHGIDKYREEKADKASNEFQLFSLRAAVSTGLLKKRFEELAEQRLKTIQNSGRIQSVTLIRLLERVDILSANSKRKDDDQQPRLIGYREWLSDNFKSHIVGSLKQLVGYMAGLQVFNAIVEIVCKPFDDDSIASSIVDDLHNWKVISGIIAFDMLLSICAVGFKLYNEYRSSPRNDLIAWSETRYEMLRARLCEIDNVLLKLRDVQIKGLESSRCDSPSIDEKITDRDKKSIAVYIEASAKRSLLSPRTATPVTPSATPRSANGVTNGAHVPLLHAENNKRKCCTIL